MYAKSTPKINNLNINIFDEDDLSEAIAYSI